nr:hypothetical protein [Tanacetum cinerariifolium]
MTQLTFVRLAYNGFTGTIPESIRSLTNLTTLDLGGNNFNGIIPKTICSLTKLTSLNLYGNNFSGTIPMSIGSLTKLKSLGLSDNSFYGTIPREFGNLTNLEYLNLYSLGSCRVENLDWLSSLSSLEVLIMDGTSLAKANKWVNVIIGLQNLYYLSLVGCDLSHVMHPYSSSVNSSSSIIYLYLQKNNLNSPMYSWLCPLFGKKLERLVISCNKFDGNLSDLLNTLSTSANSLERLDASSNQFTGSLSDEIQNFSFLTTLNLSLNQLNGIISDKLWQLPNLQTLDISSNSLTGVISENMLNLSQSICYIDFSSNKLGPRFPKWTQKLKNLIDLDLSNNSISDTVSTEYWNWWKSSRLSYLDLSCNNITAHTCIDKERQALLDFKALMLSTWRPEEEDDCCRWRGVWCNDQTGHVTELDLSYYGLGGEISLSLLNLTYLNHLDLSYNSFNGTFPKFICSMTHLTFLSLSYNMFTGTIPESIGNLTQLTYLDLGLNKFSGVIPESIASLTKLTQLRLDGNNFNGTIPISIGSLTSLTYLVLSENEFSGTIPMSIGSLTKLTSLHLSDNSFYGTIPREFGNLTNLEYLDLDSLGSCRVENLDWLSSLSSLEELYMDGTSLAKANNWVNVIIGLQNLSTLSLDGCDLSRVMHPYSSSVNSSSSINSLFLQKNNLNSPMYSWMCPLFGKKLKRLEISGNTFDGNLSDFLNTLSTSATTLEYLNLSSNQLNGTICQLESLRFLDLSFNNLHGTIPPCVNNFTSMLQKGFFLEQNTHHYGMFINHSGVHDNSYIDHLLIEWQGKVNEFSRNLGLLNVIDLSSNNLTGQIPNEFTNLHGLLVLDLSNNFLVGGIPRNIGHMTELLTLNLSRNMLSGEIPATMSEMTLLNNLDIFINSNMPNKCSGDEDLGVPPVSESDGDGESTDELQRWFYIGGATGFATAFWIACSALLFNRRLRHAFFYFHNCLKDWVYVKVAVLIAKFQRAART